jgi:membrane-associated phospholipid phosphatase
MTAPPIIDAIGYYGPVILFALTFFYLIKRPPYLMMFTLGSIANTFLNRTLKSTWREPRPRGQIDFIDHNHLTGPEQYGLPSGHAQASFFALAFLFFSKGPQAVIYTMALLCILTLYQRWKYRRHTIKQLALGSLIGALFAYALVFLTEFSLYKNTFMYL